MTFQIKDWDGTFENHKSRTLRVCNYVCMPNKQSGMGFRRILHHQHGAAFFAIWCLTIQRCSAQRNPRRGWLTEDGKEGGRPWLMSDLEILWHIPPPLISAAFAFFCSEEIGWMQIHGTTVDECARLVPVKRPASVHQEEGRKEPKPPDEIQEPGLLKESPDPIPESGSRVWKKHRPADLKKSLDETWKDIAKLHGGETANAAVAAAKRLYGATATHGQLSATYQAAHRMGCLDQSPHLWPDPRAKEPKPTPDDGLPVASNEDIMEVLRSLPKPQADGFIYDPRDQ